MSAYQINFEFTDTGIPTKVVAYRVEKQGEDTTIYAGGKISRALDACVVDNAKQNNKPEPPGFGVIHVEV